jgi:integrase/recombinase XerD
MNSRQYFDLFLDFQRIERGLSSNSLTAYTRDLVHLFTFLEKEKITVSSFHETHAQELVVYLDSLNLSLRTTNRMLSTIRSFYAYLERDHSIENPMKDIVSRKIPLRLPKALTIAQVAQLIEAPLQNGHVVGLRDKAILEILYSSGARVSEIISMNLNDVSNVSADQEDVRIVKLRGKGGKERVVPLGSYSVKALDDYLVRVRPSLATKSAGAKSEALFLNQRGSRISRQSAWQICVRSKSALRPIFKIQAIGHRNLWINLETMKTPMKTGGLTS